MQSATETESSGREEGGEAAGRKGRGTFGGVEEGSDELLQLRRRHAIREAVAQQLEEVRADELTVVRHPGLFSHIKERGRGQALLHARDKMLQNFALELEAWLVLFVSEHREGFVEETQ